jgi:thiamine monophosphate kinase
MIDVSDGLGSDAHHLASACQKKFLLDSPTITPLSPDDPSYSSIFCDGEDFELLFTCSPSVAEYLLWNFPWPCGMRRIGIVDDGQGVYLCHKDSKHPVRLEFSGYQH